MDQKRVQAPISTKPVEFVKPGQTSSSNNNMASQELKVAFDPISRTMMTQKELFERTKGTQPHISMFTALITKDLKKKYDANYKAYKDSLCEVAEVDPGHVKEMLINSTKEFFHGVRE